MEQESQPDERTSQPDTKGPADVTDDPPAETSVEEISSGVPEAKLAPALEAIEEKIGSLGSMIERRLLYDEAKEKAFDRLYAELDRERKNVSGEFVKPILRDLVLLYDHIEEALRQAPDDSTSLEFLREGLLEVLYRANVEPIARSDPKFNRSLQCVKRVVATPDEQQDWIVTEILQEGFLFGDTVLRPQQVVVQRFKREPVSDDVPE